MKLLFKITLILNLIPLALLGLWLKYLDENWMYKNISYPTLINHWELTTWFLIHLVICIGLAIYNIKSKN